MTLNPRGDMNKKHGHKNSVPKTYKAALLDLQIELVQLQRHLIKSNLQVLVLFEGRDTAGKDGVIKSITRHLSPRETRTVALGKPSDHDRRSWYFKRYVAHLPKTQEMVLMDRSWYNRAGVERVMGFCTDEEYSLFMSSVLQFEQLLINSGIQLLKYYLDISKKEQKQRLEARKKSPLKQWKTSPIDEVALDHWDDYSAARNAMLARTHNDIVPWYIVKADDKKSCRLNLIRHLLSSVEYPDKKLIFRPDPTIVFPYHEKCLENGAIYP
jgi:polyphosphate kinase 2